MVYFIRPCTNHDGECPVCLVCFNACSGKNSSTVPQFYPNMPSGVVPLGKPVSTYLPSSFFIFRLCLDICTDFQVTAQLPNVTWDLPRNWAGNIPVQRAGHPNDTLFFWAFEKERGSLTAGADERLNEPWGIWLNG